LADHLVITALLASSDVILSIGYPFSWINNPLFKAALALDQPHFARAIRHIGAVIGLDQPMDFNALAPDALERMCV